VHSVNILSERIYSAQVCTIMLIVIRNVIQLVGECSLLGRDAVWFFKSRRFGVPYHLNHRSEIAILESQSWKPTNPKFVEVYINSWQDYVVHVIGKTSDIVLQPEYYRMRPHGKFMPSKCI
jgi:hypothetical protein